MASLSPSAPVPCTGWLTFSMKLLTLLMRPARVLAEWGTDHDLGGTGRTPEGCTPVRYLAPGDVVTSRIDGVGELRFRVEAHEHEPTLAGRAASSAETR